MVKVPLMSCVVGLGVLSLLPGMGCAFTRSALFRHPEMRHASAPRIFPSESVKAHERRTSKGLNSAALATVIAEHPFATAAIFCGAKASLADFVAQRRDYRKRADAIREEAGDDLPPEGTKMLVKWEEEELPEKKTDFTRNICYILYGALYQGITLEYLYNHVYDVMFGKGSNFRTVAVKVAFDMFVQATLITLPVAYLAKAAIYRYSPKEAMRRYRDDVMNHGLFTKYASLWGPVMFFTFSFVPEHLRVIFVAIISFFWLIILSSIASKKRDGDDECSLVDGVTCNIDG